jgi:hypothetical protein
MSKTLRRPMFKMGGTTDSGIVSGFEREKFNQGTKSPEEQLAELSASVRQSTADAFATPPAYSQPGFGLSEYLALAKLGANIASAPNRGSGFKGFAASTAPAFGQFAEDLDVLNRQKMQTRAAFDAAGREAKLKAEGTAASLTAEGLIQKMSEASELSNIQEQGRQDRLTNEQKTFALDNAFNTLKDVEAQYFENAAKITALDATQYATVSEYEEELRKLKIREESLTMQIFFILEQKVPKDAEIGDLTAGGILTDAKDEALKVLNLVEEPAPGDDMYTEFGLKYKEIAERMIQETRDLLTPKTGFETPVIGMAKGGRVGLANGGGPYEPGSGPDPDPGSPPIMQAEGQSPRGSSILSFAELRARLPREVSDEVVRLLATSEAALLDFAQIQTQDDIARFNKNYSADLQLPAQTQVV